MAFISAIVPGVLGLAFPKAVGTFIDELLRGKPKRRRPAELLRRPVALRSMG